MRSFRLARAAAQAEVLHLRRMVRRQALRVVWAVVAAVFALGALALLHVLGYLGLRAADLSPLASVAIVFAVDVVLTGIFGIFAMRGAPDPEEREAAALRDRALSELRQSLALAALVGPVGRVALRTAGRVVSRRK